MLNVELSNTTGLKEYKDITKSQTPDKWEQVSVGEAGAETKAQENTGELTPTPTLKLT